MYNSKWIKDINLKCKILKQVEINIAAILQDIDTGYTLLNKSLLAEEIRTSIGKWCFCTGKEMAEQNYSIQHERKIL